MERFFPPFLKNIKGKFKSVFIVWKPHPGPPYVSRVSMKGSGDASDLTDASELWGCEVEAQSSGFQTTEGFMSCCWDTDLGKDHQHSPNQASSGRWEVTGNGSLTTEGCASRLPPFVLPCSHTCSTNSPQAPGAWQWAAETEVNNTSTSLCGAGCLEERIMDI